ncbi:metalloregulator ArsR/SmtB family transcription factor [Chitinophaga sp.]|uniref:ArsR/SmtB family transcription factor n=1 Tax=Chitinophaga sp. TaxID=1869181 RepID=UPI0031E40606
MLQPDPFQAIADPGRREILFLLSKEKLSMNALAENFEISRPAVSKHVKILYEAGLIMITEQGRERYCELNPDGFKEIRGWLEYYERFWEEKMGNLGRVLKKRAKG